jgi:hypothetical protein
VAIGSPREFVLGGLFAPPRVPCGKLVLETRFAEVAANAASSAAGAWIRGSCVLGGEPWSAWYLFPTARVEVAKGLAACLFRGALRRLAGALGVDPVRPSLAAALPPEPSGSARFVGLSAEVRAGTLRVPLDVLVEHDAVASLARAFCDPAELAPRPGGGSRSMLPLVLSLNESLLRRGLPDLARGLVAPTAGGELFSFAAFLDLLPDRDAALLLQNHLSRTLGGRSLRALFGYRAAAAGARGAVVSPVLVDEERLLRLLPQAGREAWERDRGDDARAGSFADFLALNREVLAGAWRAARTRSLLLSPRALFLLEKAVAPGLRRDALAKIAAMAAAGEPLGGLREMPEPRVQQVLAALPTRSLCLSLLGVPAERAYVEARSSRTRRARLGEDLALLGERFRRGEVEADDVLAAMREVGAAVAAAVAKAAAAKAR